jgi:hypothetical protein
MSKFSTYAKFMSFCALTLFVAQASFAQYGQVSFDDMPPQPSQYGKCYAKCKVADQYETVPVQVLVKEASSKTVTSPARYETITEQVLVKDASTKLVPVPAEYETVTEQVLIKESSTKLREIPPKYSTVSEKVLVQEAHGKWVKKKKSPSCLAQNPDDCYVMCWEEVPAKYRTETRKVITEPGRTETSEIPGQYKTITKKVLRSPATVKEVTIPAEYSTITKKVLAEPARTEEVTIPAEYKTVNEKRLVKQGGFTRWVEIVCEQNVNNGLIRSVQQALKDRGYDPGPIDGVMGSQTRSALERYQSANGLPLGNLNTETLSSLGVN